MKACANVSRSCQVVLKNYDTPVGQKMKPVQTSRQILHQFAIYPCGRRVPRCNTRPQPAHLGRYCWRLECFMSWTLTRTVIQADSPSSLLDDNDGIGHLQQRPRYAVLGGRGFGWIPATRNGRIIKEVIQCKDADWGNH